MTCNCDYCKYLAGDNAALVRVAKEIGETVVCNTISEILAKPETLDRLMEVIATGMKQRGLA